MIFIPLCARKVVTDETIPGRSGHESVRIELGGSEDLDFMEGREDGGEVDGMGEETGAGRSERFSRSESVRRVRRAR